MSFAFFFFFNYKNKVIYCIQFCVWGGGPQEIKSFTCLAVLRRNHSFLRGAHAGPTRGRTRGGTRGPRGTAHLKKSDQKCTIRIAFFSHIFSNSFHFVFRVLSCSQIVDRFSTLCNFFFFFSFYTRSKITLLGVENREKVEKS